MKYDVVFAIFFVLAKNEHVNAFAINIPKGSLHLKTPLSCLQMAAIEVAMPALSSTMKEGKIVAWNKKVGDRVEVGDILMVVESDKADMDVESFESGWLAQIITPEGGTQNVGASVALLSSTKEELASVAAGGGGASKAAIPVAPAAPAGPVLAGFGIAVDMPALSSTMKEGKIVAWNKKIGDKGSYLYQTFKSATGNYTNIENSYATRTLLSLYS